VDIIHVKMHQMENKSNFTKLYVNLIESSSSVVQHDSERMESNFDDQSRAKLLTWYQQPLKEFSHSYVLV
jgi:hypothetical protein